MKKFFYILLAALVGAVSCNVSEPLPEQPNDGKVTLMMKVTFPELFVNVKSSDMATTPNIDNIYVATFGSRHALNDYVMAVPCDASGTELSGFSGIGNNTAFYFKVTLAATQTVRYVHVIANGPESLDYNTPEEDLMKNLTTTDGVGSYWTYLVLPNGTATADGEPLEDAETRMTNLQLIRNFAKVSVSLATNLTDDDFILDGFNVYNTATDGSVVVWSETEGGFFPTYCDKDEDYLNENYSAFMPKDGINSAEPKTTDIFNNAEKFVYEREDKTPTRPYIIIKGRYKGEEEETYYRMDFVDDDGNYLTLYRNYEYKIVLTSVSKRGVTDPKDAKASNANVSSIEATQSLTDLSDGVSRIYVLWLDHAYMDADTQTFKYMYLSNAATDTQSAEASLSIVSGAGEAISGATAAAAFTQTGPGTDGWYTVTFNTTTPATDGKEKITKFRVTGHHEDEEHHDHKLYRDITVRVLPHQSWTTPTVSSEGSDIGDKVTVNLQLPTGLPASIFPLIISFEDNNKALNPYDIDMPAVVAKSIIPNSGTEKSYHFDKTISYKEYTDNSTIVCEFKRIRTGPSLLYFKNEYFNDVNNSVQIPD